jgi:trehalose 6-phosphate synthase/phosphatase
VFRTLPWRRELLDGLLGADLVGFPHAYSYLRHFVASLGSTSKGSKPTSIASADGPRVRLGAFPMGIDAAGFAAHARDPRSSKRPRRSARCRRPPDPARRGPARLHQGHPAPAAGIERLLMRYRELRDDALIQVAVPSRARWTPTSEFRRQVEEAVGRINGTCGTHAVHADPLRLPVGVERRAGGALPARPT